MSGRYFGISGTGLNISEIRLKHVRIFLKDLEKQPGRGHVIMYNKEYNCSFVYSSKKGRPSNKLNYEQKKAC